MNGESDEDDTEAVDELLAVLDREQELLDRIRATRERRRKSLREELASRIDVGDVDEERIDEFATKPYKVLPKGENEAYVVVPRFVPFHIGWLHDQDEAWNTFVVNKYVDWIDSLPDEIRDKVGISPTFGDVTVSDGIAEFATETDRERAWERDEYREHFYQRRGDTAVKLNRESEFDVIAQFIDDGNLPFDPSPIVVEELRPEPTTLELREYQERAWKTFLETGMVGVYWPPGAGKTFLAMYAGERLPGRKLVVVPSNTLKEQWNRRLREFSRHPCEWEVQTYQYLTYGDNIESYQGDDLEFTVFDECHRLPATTYSKLATIETTHRMGLSASPYREDGRTEYIFALTGKPVGLEWQELIELGAVDQPDVKVLLYRTKRQKRVDVSELVAERTGKILVFCDSLDEGERLSEELGVPFVSGKTRNRLETFEENRVVIASRVADEGLSLPDLDHVIEFDFLYGSRRQEAQRVGRVMHGEDGAGEHVVMMTDAELEDYEKRLYALEEQGFGVRFSRRA